jgi:hypothetical protein
VRGLSASLRQSSVICSRLAVCLFKASSGVEKVARTV